MKFKIEKTKFGHVYLIKYNNDVSAAYIYCQYNPPQISFASADLVDADLVIYVGEKLKDIMKFCETGIFPEFVETCSTESQK